MFDKFCLLIIIIIIIIIIFIVPKGKFGFTDLFKTQNSSTKQTTEHITEYKQATENETSQGQVMSTTNTEKPSYRQISLFNAAMADGTKLLLNRTFFHASVLYLRPDGKRRK